LETIFPENILTGAKHADFSFFEIWSNFNKLKTPDENEYLSWY